MHPHSPTYFSVQSKMWEKKIKWGRNWAKSNQPLMILDVFSLSKLQWMLKWGNSVSAKCTLERDQRVWLDNFILKVYKLWIISKTLAKAKNRWDYPGMIWGGSSCLLVWSLWHTQESHKVVENVISAGIRPAWTGQDKTWGYDTMLLGFQNSTGRQPEYIATQQQTWVFLQGNGRTNLRQKQIDHQVQNVETHAQTGELQVTNDYADSET